MRATILTRRMFALSLFAPFFLKPPVLKASVQDRYEAYALGRKWRFLEMDEVRELENKKPAMLRMARDDQRLGGCAESDSTITKADLRRLMELLAKDKHARDVVIERLARKHLQLLRQWNAR